jgi:hypothetical protein
MVYKVALRQVFSEYFGFPYQFSFYRLLHTHHLSSGVGTIGELVPTYQVDSVSPHHKILKNVVTGHLENIGNVFESGTERS